MIANKYGEGDVIASFQESYPVSYDFMDSWVADIDRFGRTGERLDKYLAGY